MGSRDEVARIEAHVRGGGDDGRPGHEHALGEPSLEQKHRATRPQPLWPPVHSPPTHSYPEYRPSPPLNAFVTPPNPSGSTDTTQGASSRCSPYLGTINESEGSADAWERV